MLLPLRHVLARSPKMFYHPERHFGSKTKFLVLGMKLPNLRSFAIIGEENKIGMALKDNTSVIVCLYRYKGMGVLAPYYKRKCLGWNCSCRRPIFGKYYLCNFDKQTVPSARSKSVSTYYLVNFRCCLKIITINGSELFTFQKETTST
jgi:hypothetical protein